MPIYAGDPQERFRTRRRLTQALGGVLFLPAQGSFLLLALRTQSPLAWIGWVAVLAALITAATVWIRDRRWSNLAATPWIPGPLLPIEVAALIGASIVRAIVAA